MSRAGEGPWGLAARSVQEWEILLVELARLGKTRAWAEVQNRLRALQVEAVRRGMSLKSSAEETLWAKGENKAYVRAIMVLEELIRDVESQVSRTGARTDGVADAPR